MIWILFRFEFMRRKRKPQSCHRTKTSATRSPPDHHSVIISWIFLIVRTSEDQHQSEFKRKTEKSRKKLGQKTVKRRRFKALDVWTETDTARVIGTRVLTEQHPGGNEHRKKNGISLTTTTSRKQSPPRMRRSLGKRFLTRRPTDGVDPA